MRYVDADKDEVRVSFAIPVSLADKAMRTAPDSEARLTFITIMGWRTFDAIMAARVEAAEK